MDKSIRVYRSLREMKRDELRYWQSRPVHERMAAVAELSLEAYALKGTDPNAPRPEGPVVRPKRPQR